MMIQNNGEDVMIKKVFFFLIVLSLSAEGAWDPEELGVAGVCGFIGGAAGHFIGHSLTGGALEQIDDVTPQSGGIITSILRDAQKGHEKREASDAGSEYVVPLCTAMGTCAGAAFGAWVRTSVVDSIKSLYNYYIGGTGSEPTRKDYVNISAFTGLTGSYRSGCNLYH